MSALPRITCIIPAYNAGKYLAKTLDSMLAQEGVSLEILVVDDGSEDDTAAVALSYRDRVRLVQQANGGHSAARNRGFQETQEAFVTFMDADDLSPPDRFAIQLNAFAEDPDLELCAAHVRNFRDDLQFEGEALPAYNTDLLLRRSVFERVGFFKPELQHAARLDWMLRARKQNVKERLLPDVLVYRRLHGENMSLQHSNRSLREHLHVLQASIKQRRG